MRGAAMKVVQALLGHATIEMTMRYAHLSADVPRHVGTCLDGLGSSAAPRRTLTKNRNEVVEMNGIEPSAS